MESRKSSADYSQKLKYDVKDYSVTELNEPIISLSEPDKHFSAKSLYFVYIFFTIMNVTVNMDSGNIPPVTNDISKEFGISSKQVGGLASFVSIGTLFGGIISLSIIDRFPRKVIMITANLSVAVCLFIFPLFESPIILYINRVVVGVFMVNLLTICLL